ncbi:MAG: hypothetical protein H8D23_03805 [Candidatus Brocadiales bacterium]|nr:hypothetical protein [Candidatus Brocadiales bacterium]
MTVTRLNIFANYDKREDNVTHGFLSLLNCLEPKTASQIINQLIPSIKLRDNLRFELQSPSPIMRNTLGKCSRGYIIGISAWDKKISNDISDKQDSRADGWISDGKIALLIEAKVVGRFSGHQLNRHRSQLDGLIGQGNHIKDYITTWQKIDSALKHYQSDTDISKSEAILISEFRSYLQMERLTLDFEQLFNASKYDITEQWISDQPKISLRELKKRLLGELDTNAIRNRTEQVNEHKYKALWLRLFSLENLSLDWRSSVYLNPDEVAVDLLAFRPGKRLPEAVDLIESLKRSIEKEGGFEALRTWIYASNYGKRRNVQSGRNYDYNVLNFNIAKGSKALNANEDLLTILRKLDVKQIGIRFAISNPGAMSKAYWLSDISTPDNVNHADATLLKHPDDLIKKLTWFLQAGINEITKQ